MQPILKNNETGPLSPGQKKTKLLIRKQQLEKELAAVTKELIALRNVQAE